MLELLLIEENRLIPPPGELTWYWDQSREEACRRTQHSSRRGHICGGRDGGSSSCAWLASVTCVPERS